MLATEVIVLATTIAFSSPPSDFPQWRGPHRDGAVSPDGLPGAWPKSLEKLWEVPVGEGYSSPLVAEGMVYVQSRRGEEEVLTVLDLESGRIVSESRREAPYAVNPAAVRFGKGPKSTPALDGDRVCTLAINGGLSCFDRDGRLLWRHGFDGRFATTAPLYGAAASPLFYGGRLIAAVGGHDDGALVAFSPDDGRELWSWPGDGPGYASPIVLAAEGGPQLVTLTQQAAVALDPATGGELWRLPFRTAYDQNIVTPVAHGRRLILSGIDRGILALTPRRSAEGWAAITLWHNEGLSLYMSTPVVVGDRLFGLSHQRKGQLFALDARNGSTLWRSPGRDGENAALIAAGDTLLVLTTDARLTVLDARADAFQPLASYAVADSPTWAHPALVGGLLLVKAREKLIAWSLSGPPVPRSPPREPGGAGDRPRSAAGQP